MFKQLLFSALCLTIATASFAQERVLGRVIDGATEQAVIGASVFIEGSQSGAFTDFDGVFSFTTRDTGSQTLVVTSVGYERLETAIQVGENTDVGTISMNASTIGLDEVNIIASVAIDRKTPVAVSTLNAEFIENNLGSKELPEILNITPGVYATKQGGGAGDSRINIRGFNQRNVAVLINGIPVNDMENGWVYWSNWAGLGDAVSTIQVQRGLGASKLAINSVGGTMNIITKTTDAVHGGSFKQSVTSYGNTKSMLALNSGLLESGWAFTFVGSRTEGPGYVDATYVDAWSYFLSAAKDFNNHRLVFTAIGAPQKHGQRSAAISVDDHNKYGNKYNSDWGYMNGQMLNQRENYYHKPQFSFNHYWSLDDRTTLNTSFYISTGSGGGSGPLGNWASRDAFGQFDWDSVVEGNVANADTVTHIAYNDDVVNSGDVVVIDGDTLVGGSNTILRNSVNNHFWTGLLSTFKREINPNLNLIAGVDARYYRGEHYREVRNLMGGDFWFEGFKYAADGLNPNYNQVAGVGDRIAYDNDGIVGYGGVFGQLEYSDEQLSAFAAATVSSTNYQRVDRYNYHDVEETSVSGTDVTYGTNSQKANSLGYNFKAGANYNIDENHNLYANAGFYNRAPFFRFVYVSYSNQLSNEELVNEKIIGMEAGYGYRSGKVSLNVNAYNTIWQDKSMLSRRYNSDDGSSKNYFITGLDAVHRGLEVEFKAKPSNKLEVGGMVSLGDWAWANDVEAVITDDISTEVLDTAYVYASGLKVGDAPQTQMGLFGTWNLSKSIRIGATYVYNTNLYSSFDVEDRDNPDYTEQAYQLPSFGYLDLNASWNFKVGNTNCTAAASCYNALDNVYMQEAYEDFGSDSEGNVVANSIESGNLQGFWAFGRNWNFSLKMNF